MRQKTGSHEPHSKTISSIETEKGVNPPEIETCPVFDRRAATKGNRFRRWFFEGLRETSVDKRVQEPWWKVMTLTGVGYFSTLGYVPGIAFLAAGSLSPIATIMLAVLTVFGAVPVYQRVAQDSPHGKGSIAILERLLPGWKGKLVVLSLLGFLATSWILTLTLSAADAATHLIQNPLWPQALQNQMLLTMLLVLGCGAIFLKGFREAIGICVWTTAIYLVLNIVVMAAAILNLGQHPEAFANWTQTVSTSHHDSIISILVAGAILFPKLAVGLSGFETGVAVMPHVQGAPSDTREAPIGRIKNTKKLLITAAVILSVFMIIGSLVTTLLIPPEEFSAGGKANGRALAYLAHAMLPPAVATLYDLSTVAILWLAGASALAGLLSLVPTYLPRYGMAPDWSRATRPLVVFFTAVCMLVTWWFKADVDAQGEAYATGVLMVMTSAGLAATLLAWKTQRVRRWLYALTTVAFLYTTWINASDQPDGLRIAAIFVAVVMVTSIVSRVMRATELRVKRVVLDERAQDFIAEDLLHNGIIRIVAHRPGGIDYPKKSEEARATHRLRGDFVFLEVSVEDASEFQSDEVHIHGVRTGNGYRILRCESAAVPNTIAALLLHLRDTTKTTPHLYTGWTEGNPFSYILQYVFLGEGETAPMTREILRENEKDPAKRPRVHVG